MPIRLPPTRPTATESTVAGEPAQQEENKYGFGVMPPQVRGFRNRNGGSPCPSHGGSSGRRAIGPALFAGNRARAHTQRHHQGLSRKNRECRRWKDQDATIRERTTVS